MRALPANVFLRLPQVLARVPISRSTLWRRVNDGTFPRPLKLSARVTVWRSEEIDGWMHEQQ
ncbi:helix-turn-helix transcriptional regulator [Xanthomonas arboricola]|jgi:predicted DNA-binding transcriptional regulator AlpA|uniref:helix-turn-helix transcriptional regulator n=1 Tax=Xanthomonas arboricola TaxID=56448 RepID=UPI003CCE96D3